MILKYITCVKCKKQQPRDNFWQGSAIQKNCKFCNNKTNIIPPIYEVKTEDALKYLTKIVFDPKNETSMILQMQMDKIFIFLERQISKEEEEVQ